MAAVHRIGFTELSHNTGQQNGLHQLNIIFVHGLRGHPQSTWEDRGEAGDATSTASAAPPKRSLLKLRFHKKRSEPTAVDSAATKDVPQPSNAIFWPRDYLIHDLPEARVWTYGYNADVIGGMFEANNQNSVSQHGQDLAVKFERDIRNQDPVVFVAHSLGGIIVKDALRRSNICRLRTKLVVFLGTPHRGSSYADWAAVAFNLASLALQGYNQRILKTLEVNAEVLDNIHDEFQRIVQDGVIRVHSFQEARGLVGIKGLEGKVVSDFSSKIGLVPPFETVESIDANHMQMARCRHKDDPRYLAILGVLRQFIRDRLGEEPAERQQITYPIRNNSPQERATVQQSDQPNGTPGQTHYHIQLTKNTRFIGRTAVLDELEDKFFVRKECRTIALAGLGGVGKTQVALQFAYQVKEQHPEYSVFWVATLSDTTFEQAYTEIANKLGVQKIGEEEDIKEALCRHLGSEKAGKWLIVVDNADDPSLLYGSATRSGIVKYIPASEGGLVLLTTRSREVAVDFAQTDVIDVGKMDAEEATRFLEKSLISKEALQDEALINDLLSSLAFLPLAISQAAAYLNQTKIPVTRYLQLLKGAESDVAKLFSKEFRDRTRYDGSHNAVARTWLVSFEQIHKLDQVAVDLLEFLSFIEPKAVPQSILPRFQSVETESAIGILCGYSFLTRRGDTDIFDMHSLVHMAARVWIGDEGRTNLALEEVIHHMVGTFPRNDRENRNIWRRYLPHASQVLDRSRGYELDDRYELAYHVARCLVTDRRFKEGIAYFEDVYQWKSERLPKDDDSLLELEDCLASAYLRDRRVKEAIDMLEDIVALRKEMLDQEHQARLASEHLLASAYLEDRRFRDAIRMLEHVVEIKRELLDAKDHIRQASEQMLARAYLDNDRIEEGVEMFAYLVTIQKATLDEDDHYRLVSEHMLAKAYLDNGRVQEATEMLEYLLAIEKDMLDAKDHSRLMTEHELARAYLENRRVAEAVELLEHVVAMQKETLRVEDHSRLISQHSLARAYLHNGQAQKAVEILEHVVVVQEKVLAEDDHGRWMSRDLLAEAYRQLAKG